MQYLGGKSRIAKPLSLYLESRRDGRIYYEPFLGAAHVLLEMQGERIGSDVNHDLILMWQAVQSGWMPPESVSEIEYQALKACCPCALRAYVGFQGSFGGKWFAGYAQNGRGDNYIHQGHRSLRYAFPRLQGVKLITAPYNAIDGLQGFLIYCDPPYESTTQYNAAPSFDHGHFWQWVRNMSLRNVVLVSSYQAPSDFSSVWSIETHTEMRTNNGRALRVEKLFEYDGQREYQTVT